MPFFLVKIDCNRPAYFNIAFVGKSVSTYIVTTNVAALGSTYDVTSGNGCDQSQDCAVGTQNFGLPLLNF